MTERTQAARRADCSAAQRNSRPLLLVTALLALTAAALVALQPARAQQVAEAAAETPLFTPEELDALVGPVALYPDDLIAIVLPAATYPLDIVQAARFQQEHEQNPSLEPDESWDDSIVALLNYPDVLQMLNEDLEWTWDLGEAFLTQPDAVLDAVQRYRELARDAGNLASNDRQVVSEDDGVIEIEPADPKVIYVPYYEPARVIVHRHEPIYYYPRPYPVYYYPYPAGYSFHSGFFWGVTSAFVIGWNTHLLHVHHHSHLAHPYYRHSYFDPFYVRRSINVNIVNVDRGRHLWRPGHRHGVRPGGVTVTRFEGRSRGDYAPRRVTRSSEGRRYGARSNALTLRSRTNAAASGTRSTARIAGSGRSSANVRSRHSNADAGNPRAQRRESVAEGLATRRIPPASRSVERTRTDSNRFSTSRRQAAPTARMAPGTRAPSSRSTSRDRSRSTATSRLAPSSRAPAASMAPSRARSTRAPESRAAPAVRTRMAPSSRATPRPSFRTRSATRSAQRSATRSSATRSATRSAPRSATRSATRSAPRSRMAPRASGRARH